MTPPLPRLIHQHLNRRDALHQSLAIALSAHKLSLGLLAGSSLATATTAVRAQSTAAASGLPRLVTLGGAITEIAYLLGAEGQLVGTDTTSNFPEAAQKTAKVGYMRALSAEGLLSLRPQAVIATHEAGPPVVLDQIRSAGVKVEQIVADHTWGELERKVRAVGRLSQRETLAQQLMAQLDAQWRATTQQVQRYSGRKPRMLFIMAHAQSANVAGEQTAADALIRMIGGLNCLSGFNGYRPMTAEAMAAAAPDVILTSTQSISAQGGEDKLWARSELALTPAFKRRKLIHMEAQYMLGFGPRLPDTVLELHRKAVLA